MGIGRGILLLQGKRLGRKHEVEQKHLGVVDIHPADGHECLDRDVTSRIVRESPPNPREPAIAVPTGLVGPAQVMERQCQQEVVERACASGRVAALASTAAAGAHSPSRM